MPDTVLIPTLKAKFHYGFKDCVRLVSSMQIKFKSIFWFGGTILHQVVHSAAAPYWKTKARTNPLSEVHYTPSLSEGTRIGPYIFISVHLVWIVSLSLIDLLLHVHNNKNPNKTKITLGIDFHKTSPGTLPHRLLPKVSF